MAKTNELATKTEQIDLRNPNNVMNFATNLKSIIVQNKLYTPIQGKNYVNVEGWQIAGAFTGIHPILEILDNQSDGDVYKYRAEVTLRDENDKIVGYGVAICSNKEKNKKSFDEYAIASMAQTRAVGKAFRLKIGWLLKLAGYETTPAEEVAATEAEIVKEQKPKYTTRDIGVAKKQLELANTMAELKSIFGGLGDIRIAPEVIAKKDEMKKILSAKETKNETSKD